MSEVTRLMTGLFLSLYRVSLSILAIFSASHIINTGIEFIVILNQEREFIMRICRVCTQVESSAQQCTFELTNAIIN